MLELAAELVQHVLERRARLAAVGRIVPVLVRVVHHVGEGQLEGDSTERRR